MGKSSNISVYWIHKLASFCNLAAAVYYGHLESLCSGYLKM